MARNMPQTPLGQGHSRQTPRSVFGLSSLEGKAADSCTPSSPMELFARSTDWERCESLYDELCYKEERKPAGRGFPELVNVLFKYCRPSDDLLLVAAEPSNLAQKFREAGIPNTVVRGNCGAVADLKNGEREDGKQGETEIFTPDSFHVVVHEGKLDELYREGGVTKETEQTLDDVRTILKTGGRYLCITFAPGALLSKLLDHFSNGWLIRVHKVDPVERSNQLPLFVFVFTKIRLTVPSAGTSVQALTILELCLQGVDFIQRSDSLESVKAAVQECQAYSVIRRKLVEQHLEERLSVDLWVASGSDKERKSPRYSLSVVDIPACETKNGKFAVFIVPEGREVEWMFSTSDGQRQLASTAGFARLVIALLNRDHVYSSLDMVKQELSCRVMELAPPGIGQNIQVPFLSVGEDVGSRKVLYEGKSELSGNYVVEDVTGEEGETYRRLIFLNNKNTVQSEAKLVSVTQNPRKGKNRKDKSKRQVDFSHLSCQHHKAVVTGLSLVDGLTRSDDSISCLLVGLGGGGLPTFLHQYINQLSLDVVELDPGMLTIAKCWFGFVEDERMKVIIEDGLKFIRERADAVPPRCYDVIILDVDSKDPRLGMSAPPAEFVENSVLHCMQTLLHPTGILILNLVCRDQELKSQVLSDMQSVFPWLGTLEVKDQVNEIVLALPQARGKDWNNSGAQEKIIEVLCASASKLQHKVQPAHKNKLWDKSLDLCGMMAGLRVL